MFGFARNGAARDGSKREPAKTYCAIKGMFRPRFLRPFTLRGHSQTTAQRSSVQAASERQTGDFKMPQTAKNLQAAHDGE